MRESVLSMLESLGLADSPWIATLTFLFWALLLTLFYYLIAKTVVERGLRRLLQKFKGMFFPILAQSKTLRYAYLFTVFMVFKALVEVLFLPGDDLRGLLVITSDVMILLFIGLALASLIDVLGRVAMRNKKLEGMPIQGIQQTLKLIVTVITVILIISTLAGKSPAIIISGLGAMTAVTMLIFQNTITGFVAGIQLSANNMLKVGDWLEMPKYGANGDVIEIGITTVKVQNFDKTVSTIPTSALVSDSFINWTPMSQGGGRRIKRQIFIDIDSIRFMTEEELEAIRGSRRLHDYLFNKSREINEYNREINSEGKAAILDRRQMTNIGVFRAYINSYLQQHPRLHKGFTMMVRQMEPTAQGVPLEIYCFTNTAVWVEYESIQSDIFDYVIAVAPLFGLRLFQSPTGHDFKTATEQMLESTCAMKAKEEQAADTSGERPLS